MEGAHRRRWSYALAVLGALLLLIGSVLFYAREELFNSDAFADNAQQALDDERVRAALTVPIVDTIIDQGSPDLINAQPILESAISGVLGSGPFESLFRNAVRKAHESLFSEGTEKLVLTLADAGIVVINAVRAISPDAAKQIPDDLEPTLVQVSDSDVAIGAADLAEDVRILALILPILGLGVLIASVALRRSRRDGVVVAAAAVAVAAGLGIVALLVGKGLVLAQFDDDLVSDAVDATWSAFLGGLFDWLLILGVAGVIVAAAAYAGVRQVDPAAPFRRLSEIARQTPAGSGARFARAVGILGLSLLLVLRPDEALQIVVVAVGGWGLFIAVTEILLVIAPPQEAVTAGPGERAASLISRVRWKRVLSFGAGLAAIAVGFAIVLSIDSGGGPVQRPPGAVTSCNGHEELCDRPINEVVFPGTHNSMSASRDGFITANQRNGIGRQLDDGIRALLIDTHYGVPSSGSTVITDLTKEGTTTEEIEAAIGQEGLAAVERARGRLAFDEDPGDSVPYLCHVMCEVGATELTEALTEVREFLDTHPDEFLVMFVEDVVTPQDAAPAFEESGLLRYTYVHEPGKPFPTMRELIEDDTRLLVLGEENSGGAELPWYQDGFELVQETPFTFHSPAELADKASCDENRGSPENPLFQINNWVEAIPRSPDTAEKVNSFDTLKERAALCERRRDLRPNLLAVDFYDRGDVFGVANVLNGLDKDAEPSTRSLR